MDESQQQLKPSVVDNQLTTKARRDLEDIIELSGQIRKSSERFKESEQPINSFPSRGDDTRRGKIRGWVANRSGL
jgi:hypothetical protein